MKGAYKKLRTLKAKTQNVDPYTSELFALPKWRWSAGIGYVNGLG